MLGINSGYAVHAIRLNCACSSRAVTLVSIPDFNAATINARWAKRPMYGEPSALLPLAVTHELVSNKSQYEVCVAGFWLVPAWIATYNTALYNT